MPRPRRDLSRVPGFRPPRRIRLADRLFEDVGITDEHVTEHDGSAYVTPSIYYDDRQEDHDRAAD